MRAVRTLRERGIEAVGVTVGGGDRRGRCATQLGLEHAVHVLEPTDDVRTLYSAADVFMSPSRAEGTPYSVMEALSSGTAVVASDIPGHALMGAGIDSCAITPHDPGHIAAAVERLIDRAPHEVAADALAASSLDAREPALPRWSAGLVDRYEHALQARPDRRPPPA